MHRTYRFLDAPPRLFGFTFWQWVALVAAVGGGYGAVKLLGVPGKPAVVAGVFVIGLPASLAYLGEGEGLGASGVLADAVRWCWMRLARGGARDAAGLLDLAVIGVDGVAERGDGVLLRYLEVEAPINPLVADDRSLEQVSEAFAGVLCRLEGGQGLQFYLQARPLLLGELLAGEAQQVALAASAAELEGRGELARAMRRLGAAREQSLACHCEAVAAMSLRYLVVVPWRPARTAGGRSEDAVARARERGLRESLRQAEGVRRDLEAMRMPARMLDGAAVMDLLWSRFDPDAAGDGTPPASFMAPQALAAGTGPEALAEAICSAPIDFRGRDVARVGAGVEQVSALAGVPERTWAGWLLHLMQCPCAWSLAVHVTATDRLKERAAQRRRWRRIRGVNIGAER
ncbi:MAG: PrgI family protein, partial [Solirubrobacteraceae bacterium]